MNTNEGLSLFTDTEEHTLPPFSMSEQARSCENLHENGDCEESAKPFMHAPVEPPDHSHNGVCFVTIDSFEPDSSDGEENVSLYEDISLKTEADGNLHLISNTICELQKHSPNETLSEFSSLNHTCVQDRISQGSTTALSKHSTLDLYTAPGSLSASSVSEDEATGVGSVDLCELQQNKSKTDLIGKHNLEICSENNTGGAKIDPTNEPVVRPKIRKTYPTVSSGKDPLITEENGKEAKSSRREKRELHANRQKSSKVDKVNSAKEPGSVCVEGAQKKIKGASKDILTPTDSKPLVDDTFWDDFKFYGVKIMDSAKDEDR